MSKEGYGGREPDLRLAGLSIWVRGREFPESDDYWDGNWLFVDACVEGNAAVVKATGACLRTDEIARFADQLVKLYENLQGAAHLDCMEPNLSAKVTCDKLGRVEVVIRITPDPLTQKHEFVFSVDQTYVPEAIEGCRRIVEQFPIRGKAV